MVNSFERLEQFKFLNMEQQKINLNSDLISKSNIKYKLQNILKLKLSSLRKIFSFLQTTIKFQRT